MVKRSIDAAVGSTLPDECIMQEFSFSQDYDGAGYQKVVYLDGTGGQHDVNCGCLKKKYTFAYIKTRRHGTPPGLLFLY